ncbi:hypothetical protein F4777DRAFT_598900 [Nemania sp. FL0916]|nr:hypothetical protein F4777DRAFT_598900 [Nemania sp. FL0916]
MPRTGQTNNSSLAGLYLECIDAFEKLILALSEPGCGVIYRDEIQLAPVFEEYGKTKIWGDQSKADLPAGARGSLDDTLGLDGKIEPLVRGILRRLRLLLGKAKQIGERKDDPGQDPDSDFTSSGGDSDSSTGTEEISQQHKTPKFRILFLRITDEIRSLHEISLLLRRPAVRDEFIRSGNSSVEETSLGSLDNGHPSAVFRAFDEKHVSEKVLQWRRRSRRSQRLNPLNEATAPVDDMFRHDDIEDVQWFCQRLGRANSKRRERLKHWKQYPYSPERVATTAEEAAETRNNPVYAHSIADAHDITELQVLHSRAISVLSKVSNADVALFNLDFVHHQIHSLAAMCQDGNLRPSMLSELRPAVKTFICPYCGMTLVFEHATFWQSWTRHVLLDIQPYVCTFQECPRADTLFSSVNEWKQHEYQVHRREYVCQQCGIRFDGRSRMLDHLQVHHGTSISLDQMNVILEICDRQVNPSDDKTEACLLCGNHIRLSVWHDHVAEHMEALSSFVLPTPETDNHKTEIPIASDKVEVFNDSHHGNSIRSVSNASSAEVSAIGGYGGALGNIATISAREQIDYTSKVSAWIIAVEDDSLLPDPESRTAVADRFVAYQNNKLLKLKKLQQRKLEELRAIENSLLRNTNEMQWRTSRELKRHPREGSDHSHYRGTEMPNLFMEKIQKAREAFMDQDQGSSSGMSTALRTSLIDSVFPPILPRAPSQQSSQDDIASLIQAAGTPEAVIQNLLKEKQSQSQQIAQLWHLVDNERAIARDLKMDLDRASKRQG